CARHYGPFDYW
nr:immunoglobulin heavy chain junction region [Mus musculus]MBK4189379.1 immunoglobulin heavy chain junction region [Mus musculus]